MERNEAREYIRQNVRCTDFLEKSRGGLYCCPFCGSGHKAHGTGAVKYYPKTNTVCCFGGCGKKRYDIFDIARKVFGCAEFNDAFTILADKAGITIENGSPRGGRKPDSGERAAESPENRRNAAGGTNTRQSTEKPTQGKREGTAGNLESGEGEERRDFTEYYRKCAENLTDPAAAAYLQSRGISQETAMAYGIGYDPIFISPTSAENARAEGRPLPRPSSRIIIPTGRSSFVARDTRPDPKIRYINEGKAGIFNQRALKTTSAELFVTEGAFDALSIITAGSPAIALNSTSNANLLLDTIKGERITATLVLCMDGDRRGMEAQQMLIDGLRRLNISYAVGDVLGGHKDANEALTADREGLFDAVARIRQEVRTPDGVTGYIDTLMTADIERFRHDVKTGFKALDRKAGGIYPGLYVVAAISSLGKTTWCYQMAEQIAAAGTDVLFFSLEQSRLELVSKSLARRVYIETGREDVTSLKIRRGCLEPDVITASRELKAAVENRLSVIEGDFDCDISSIGDRIRRHIAQNADRLTDEDGKERRPVVFIDYLQILQPADEKAAYRQSTKDIMDDAVRTLKRLSRELDLTIFAVSSINRANYLTPISFESLKESGGIEYTADVVFGLQLQCLNDAIFEDSKKIAEKRRIVSEAKNATPRKIELVCLKNRYGTMFSCNFDYFPHVDYFQEAKPAAGGNTWGGWDFSKAERR